LKNGGKINIDVVDNEIVLKEEQKNVETVWD
jgi:hypothetical protein